MESFKPLVRRFACPVIAAYLLHWGVWTLVFEAVQIVMSAATRILTWVAELSPAGFPRVEEAYWSAKIVAAEAGLQGLVPIGLGLLVGWFVLRRKRRRLLPDLGG